MALRAALHPDVVGLGVLVRGLAGRCRVRRVDGGGGMDHRAQVCHLRLRR